MPNNISQEKITNAITSLLQRHSILISQIVYKQKKLIFKVGVLDNKYRLMIINSNIKQNINQSIIKYMEQNYLNNILWFCYYNEFNNKLVFFINHLICDQASFNILIKDFYLLLAGNILTPLENNYFTFIDFINKNRKIKYLS